jgi:hypothetical protein
VSFIKSVILLILIFILTITVIVFAVNYNIVQSILSGRLAPKKVSLLYKHEKI